MTFATAVLAPRNLLEEGCEAFFEGRLGDAVDRFHAAARKNESDPESLYWLYSALAAAGDDDGARACLDAARDMHAAQLIQNLGVDMEAFRTRKDYAAEVGKLLYGNKLMAGATLALGASLDYERLDPSNFLSYGLSLQHQGRMAEAIKTFTVAAEVFPIGAIHEFLIFALFHAENRAERVAAEARTWSARYADLKTPPSPTFIRSGAPGRTLRVGYVGPSFTRNQVAQFLLPVLEAHDPEAFEIFLYCADPSAEGALPATCRLRAINETSDADVAAMIRADEIDILVDVWGHTAGGRLAVFAHRPAPVQVAWINFVQTTGLACMDYILHADSMAVPGTERFFTEEIVRIGPIVAPSRPSPSRPPPSPTPALANGYITFASFNHPAKLSDATVTAWARILRQRPGDRLLLKYEYFQDPVLQRVTQARFAAKGAHPAQVRFEGRSEGDDYWRSFQRVDLALDPSPCPGGTTSCDALANGVPVLTQLGDDFYARIGVPVVEPCGLPELIADGWDDYVARALDLTSDVNALGALRAKVRRGFDASPYRDEVGFTRNLEAVYQTMVARWATSAP